MKHSLFLFLFLLLSLSLVIDTQKVGAADLGKVRVIVLFQDEIDKEIIDQVDGKVIDEIQGLHALVAIIPTSSLKTIQYHPGVDRVEVDQILEIEAQTEGWGISKINAYNAWNSNVTGTGVKVAVLDSGISPHEDLEIAGGVSFVSYTSSYYDDNGHGTHVAGIIGAEKNMIGVVGVAPDASIYSVKVMDNNGQGYLSDLLEGIDWAINNKMDIVNLSIGSENGSLLLKQSVDKAYNNGLLIVAAAGNFGNSDGSGDTVEYPAKYSSVIGVSATDNNDQRGSFSATGEDVEVAAPGVNIVSTYLNNRYVSMSGTSMATPYVAGNLALFKQANPTYTNQQLRELLRATTKDIGVVGKDPFFGYGLIQASSIKGWDVEYFSNQVSLAKGVHISHDLNLDWGINSPDAKVPSDNFAVSYTKEITLEEGLYQFEGSADDSLQVSLDGKEIFATTGNQTVSKLVEVSKGKHVITVYYTEQTGNARLAFNFKKVPLFTSNKIQINDNWGWGSPSPNVPTDSFSWIFDQTANYSRGDYFVQALADDGVRVEIDGTKVIDRWTDFTNTIDRAIWVNGSSGSHTIKTFYYENVASAGIYSNIVPFDIWLAYYYSNETLSGFPEAAKIISPVGTNKKLSEYHLGSPSEGVNSDKFSARYTTAKRITAGEYILRAKADDGVRVYVDGEIVLDRWSNLGEDAVKITISDRANANAGEENVHWIEVEYRDDVSVGYIDFAIEPFEAAYQNTWVGELFPNASFQGNPYILGGNEASKKFSNINFDWGWTGSPHPSIPADHFTARFTKKETLDSGQYLFKVNADDAARVYVDQELVLDSWPETSQKTTQKWMNLNSGSHTIVIEYLEDVALATLSFDYHKYKEMPTKVGREVRYNWGGGSPGTDIPNDYFTGIFDQSGIYSSGDYFIQTFADDGIKVDVNGQTVINRWTDYTGTIERALWTGVTSGNQTVKTHYYENVAGAGVYSDIVPFDSWLAYYYSNTDLSGFPGAVKVISPVGTNKKLKEHFPASPAPGIGSDFFSARYTTAKRVVAGEYILRTKSDDGVRVYVDGKLVLNRWMRLGEEAVKLSIEDIKNAKVGDENVHWIEVEYSDVTHEGYVDVYLEPFASASTNTWLAEYYPNTTFQGTPFVAGGNEASAKISNINFDWGWSGSPHPSISADHFTARFTKKETLDAGKYLFKVNADDAARVYVDQELVLDAWPGTSQKIIQKSLNLTSGNHTIVIEYLEDVALATLSFDYHKYSEMPTKIGREVRYNWGWGSPGAGVPSDYFTGVFDQSGIYSSVDYFIQTFADDGVRVEVNGQTVINRWTDYTGAIERALWTGVTSGNQTVKTHYFENVAGAAVFSDIVPFDSWLAYYFSNNHFSGMPVYAKVLTNIEGGFEEDFGWASPNINIPSDHFSVRYTTAKRLPAGEYTISTKADDGIRVYVDGKLVIDRWNGGYDQQSLSIAITDALQNTGEESNIHWIEVEYREDVAIGYIDVSLIKK